MNAKMVFFGLLVTSLGVIGLSLLFRFGLGITFGGSTENNDASPDQSEHMTDSNNEKLDNSVENKSHNSTSYHYYTTIGSGIVVMILVIIIGGLVAYLKLRARTNITLAKVKRKNIDAQESSTSFMDPEPVQDTQGNREVSLFSYPSLSSEYRPDRPIHHPLQPSHPHHNRSHQRTQSHFTPPWFALDHLPQLQPQGHLHQNLNPHHPNPLHQHSPPVPQLQLQYSSNPQFTPQSHVPNTQHQDPSQVPSASHQPPTPSAPASSLPNQDTVTVTYDEINKLLHTKYKNEISDLMKENQSLIDKYMETQEHSI